MAIYSSIPSAETAFGSREVNGQLIPVFEGGASINVGNAVGPTYYGYGTNTPQTIPLAPGSATLGAVASGAAAPLRTGLTPGKAIALALMLIIGVAGLRYVHWRG